MTAPNVSTHSPAAYAEARAAMVLESGRMSRPADVTEPAALLALTAPEYRIARHKFVSRNGV